ncbi:hypothetical protein [Pseudoxanthomonas putridarboris]|uniref:Repeat domain-containing protein n=1 Tax=Pseudoxanthomonas putridarboris TaxID=752605 RepID=A0ABU9J0P3_9GAMM
MKPERSSLLRIICLAAALSLVLPAVQAAGPDQSQAQKIADQYVATRQASNSNPQKEYEAGRIVVADLDADGQDEIVVPWTMLGPTYWHHGVTVLARMGQRYQPAGETQEPLGSVEDLQVRDGVIVLHTKWPGLNDPRCCPSVAKTLRYRWQSGRLAPAP